MIGEFFARIDTQAALPGLRAIVEAWRPDLIVRESWEFASTLVAETHRIPLARVGLGLAEVEELAIREAAPALDAIGAELGLPADPGAERLRRSVYLTMVPRAIEDPAIAPPPDTRRFAAAAPAGEPTPLPDWWPGNRDPLVYVTFGSVTAGAHMPYFPDLYRAAIEALAPLRARILLTIGEPRDLAELAPLPANVRVEHWVPQEAVLAHAAAVVGHGGYGTTLGALRSGVPQVVVPLFSADQWANAAAVGRCGAGIALDRDRATRRVFELPGCDALASLPAAVQRVLDDGSYGLAARRIAAATAALAPVDAAVGELEAIAGAGVATGAARAAAAIA